MALDAWDVRHLLLSLDNRTGGAADERDRRDMEAVVRRAIAALAALPARPPQRAPASVTAPATVDGLPLWVVETNSWVIAVERECIVVDVPPAPDALIEHIKARRLSPVGVVLTHAHFDHGGGTGAFLSALGVRIPVYIHPADRGLVLHPEDNGVMARVADAVSPPPARALVPLPDGSELRLGPLTLRALHLPGHTPGSTCLLVQGGRAPLLFTGDTLFAGGYGRCDLPGGSRAQADASLRAVIAPLPDETVVLPGHGGITTIGAERVGPLARGDLVA